MDFRNGLFSGATGNDVCAVLDALDKSAVRVEPPPPSDVTIAEAKDDLTLAVNGYREATDLTLPVNKATQWYRVVNARDALIAAVTAHVRREQEQRRQTILHKFGYVKGADGKCACAYCVGDAEALAEYAGDMEMREHTTKQRAEAAERTVREQAQLLETAYRDRQLAERNEANLRMQVGEQAAEIERLDWLTRTLTEKVLEQTKRADTLEDQLAEQRAAEAP